MPLQSPWVTLNFNTKSPLTSKSIDTWLDRGGMPIFCGLADLGERIHAINSWVDAICYKDVQQLKDGHYDSEIAFNLLTYLAMSTDAVSIAEISHDFGITHNSIKKHLAALESLFLIYKLPSFENPRAQCKYTLFDAGVLNALRGQKTTIFSRRLSFMTLLINEIYAQYEYAGKLKPRLFYYKSKGGAEIDLALETKENLIAIECCVSDTISTNKQKGIKSFLKKYEKAVGYFIAPVQKAYQLDENIFVIPWNNMG